MSGPIMGMEREHGALAHPGMDLLAKLKVDGYVNSENSVWHLTKRGILFYDTVATEIVFNS